MQDLPFLESLNLSWNNVRHLLVVLKALSKHTAGLRCLQVRREAHVGLPTLPALV